MIVFSSIMQAVLLRRGRGQTDTHTEEKAMLSWWGASSDAATCQPKSEIPGRPQKFRGKAWSRFFFITLRRNQPPWHCDLRLLASRSVSG